MKEVKFRTPEQVYKKWLKALRSGKYQQAQGCLREVEQDDWTDEVLAVKGFCCLGVLQDIAVKDGGPKWDDPSDFDGPKSNSGVPSDQILQYLQLDDEAVEHLVYMNDEEGASFAEIADEIEFVVMPTLDLK